MLHLPVILEAFCLSRGLPPEEDVDLLLDPVLVVGSVGVGRLLVHQARQVGQLKKKETVH